jgi:ABC-type dipeptide/oligopeptide/nickel transport system ATPase component
MCDLLWLYLLAIANMYEDRYVDVPEIKWVFDTPDHPFEQYLVSKMPDAREKYRTAERTLADYL